MKLCLDYRNHDEDDDDTAENAAHALRQEALPVYRGLSTARSCTVVEDGKRLITPMLIVIVALGSTDLLFALDSIPAIYGLTQEPYLVFTANVFALMGLRQLYFLIGGLLKRLVYLSHRPVGHPGLHRRQADPARAARYHSAERGHPSVARSRSGCR